jgi:hypothetical protein
MALSISRPEFMTFLVNAKRQTYAAQGDGATVTPSSALVRISRRDLSTLAEEGSCGGRTC